ncbi:hypothetical protein BAE44_0006964, partial [Dichanthelium oligosanthes]
LWVLLLSLRKQLITKCIENSN